MACWGLNIINNRCSNNALFIMLRIMLVANCMALVICIAHFLCNMYCYNENEETHMFLPVSVFVVTIFNMLITGPYICSKISECVDDADKADSYYKVLAISIPLLGLISFFYCVYRFKAYYENTSRIRKHKRKAQDENREKKAEDEKILQEKIDEDKKVEDIRNLPPEERLRLVNKKIKNDEKANKAKQHKELLKKIEDLSVKVLAGNSTEQEKEELTRLQHYAKTGNIEQVHPDRQIPGHMLRQRPGGIAWPL